MALPRILVYDHTDRPLGELNPRKVRAAIVTSVVNGEHALEVTTSEALAKNQRLLYKDDMGHWHEYVVQGAVESREDGGEIVTEYYAVWSIQHDLAETYIDNEYGCGVVPGHPSVPQVPRRGLECALEGTSRWGISEITVETAASASFYRRSGWEGLQTVVEKWGGEVESVIGVDALGGITRAVSLLAHVGSQTASRRFDYGHDVAGIERTVLDDRFTCRIVPLGKSTETEAGGYTRRPTIASVNDGQVWLQDDSAVAATRVPDGNGGWEYPVQIVKNDTYEEPADVKQWALDNMEEWTRPKVSYEADVIQLTRAGMDAKGVALGDEVVVVDRDWGEDGLRITGRVLKLEEDLLDPASTKLTISNLSNTLADQLSDIAGQVAEITSQFESSNNYQASAAYISDLLNRLNAEANATGGFTYITEGQGIRTYDVAVSDPLVGAEASSVVEVKGGTIRIANSKTSDGDWNWQLVFTDGHVVAEMVTALNVTAGWIQGINGTYIDLDSGTVLLGNSAGFHLVADANELGFYQGQTRVAYVNNEMLYVPLAVGVNAIQVGNEGQPSWQWKLRRNGNFQLKWVGTEE